MLTQGWSVTVFMSIFKLYNDGEAYGLVSLTWLLILKYFEELFWLLWGESVTLNVKPNSIEQYWVIILYSKNFPFHECFF